MQLVNTHDGSHFRNIETGREHAVVNALQKGAVGILGRMHRCVITSKWDRSLAYP